MNWREKIELNAVLDKCNEKYDLSCVELNAPEEVKEWISQEIRKSIWLNRHITPIKNAKTIAELNRILERVFNDADQYKVWCGF